MDAKPASASASALIRWMAIADANSAGFIHGGIVMKTCDEAAGVAAVRHCGTRVVTAGMDRMTFLEPVKIGELLTCSATVNAAWRTSMEVGVRVEAEDARTGEKHHTSTAYLTMVAVDEQGKPIPVPPLLAESDDEKRRQREAETRRRNRLAEREELQSKRA
jgi:acyl-CoA hydrolase